jgi:hypothetical protein
MTKKELIELMENWPDDTIVEVRSWPFHGQIKHVQSDPILGRASIVINRHTWASKYKAMELNDK